MYINIPLILSFYSVEWNSKKKMQIELNLHVK